MKNWLSLPLLLMAITMVKLVSSAILTSPGCVEGEQGDVGLCQEEQGYSGLSDLLLFPFSLLSPYFNNNHSCLPLSLSELSWDNLFESEDEQVGRSPVQPPIKRSPTPGGSATGTTPQNLYPTPQPTGSSSPSTTLHITNEQDFALLLPNSPGELISDAESDGIAFCTHGSNDASCNGRLMQDGFVRAAAISRASDGAWIQVTGCIDPSKSSLDPSDDGGQFDVRFPNGAQCTFGGYGASFIEQIEPSNSRFCLRCCASANDQMNCNSHQDRSGCPTAIPGNYTFPAIGVDCS